MLIKKPSLQKITEYKNLKIRKGETTKKKKLRGDEKQELEREEKKKRKLPLTLKLPEVVKINKKKNKKLKGWIE